jgi:putative effector of murein hydrolase LrgA (UPF0299 family)
VLPQESSPFVSVSMRLLIVWLACMAAGTLAPFNFGDPAGTRAGGLLQHGAYQQQAADFVLNLLLFIPFGVLVHHKARRRSFKLLPITVAVATVTFLLSATVESAQAFLPSRDSSLIDVFANTTGAVIGTAADRAWGEPVVSFANSLRSKTSLKGLVSISVAWIAIALVFSGGLQARSRLSNWSVDYPLLVGNEETGNRPWRGRVLMLTLVDTATALATVRRFADGGDIVLPGTTIAAFDFTAGEPYMDRAGNVPEMRRVHRSPAASWLRSDGAAAILAQRLRASNAFTIRVRVASDDSNQYDTGCIVCNSLSPWRRNFTLGQWGDGLIIRLRTRVTGDNGTRLQMYVPDVFSTNEVRDILVTYDGATLLAAVRAGHIVSPMALGPASAVAASLTPGGIRPDRLPFYNIAYLLALFLPPAVLIGVLGHSRRDQLWLAVGYVFAFTVLFEITLTLISGRALDWNNISATGGTGVVVFLVVIGAASAPGSRRQVELPAHPRART